MTELLNAEHIHWYWLAAGILLIAFEALAPGAVLIWFGIAALITGMTCLLGDPNINQQFLLFSILAIGMTTAFKLWQRRHPPAKPLNESGGDLNQAGSQYVGMETTLATAIVNGHGRVKIADSSWRCSGPDLAEGSRVRVVAVESGTLRVEAAE